MRVRSPIGDLPFVLTAVHRDGRELVLQGDLGAWKTEIRTTVEDLPMLARSLPRAVPIAAAAALTLSAVAWRTLRRRAAV